MEYPALTRLRMVHLRRGRSHGKSVGDRNGPLFWNTYDEKGRVATQRHSNSVTVGLSLLADGDREDQTDPGQESARQTSSRNLNDAGYLIIRYKATLMGQDHKLRITNGMLRQTNFLVDVVNAAEDSTRNLLSSGDQRNAKQSETP